MTRTCKPSWSASTKPRTSLSKQCKSAMLKRRGARNTANFSAAKKVAWSQLQVPSEIQNSPWFGLLSSREKETLAWGLMSSGFKLAAADPAEQDSADSAHQQRGKKDEEASADSQLEGKEGDGASADSQKQNKKGDKGESEKPEKVSAASVSVSAGKDKQGEKGSAVSQDFPFVAVDLSQRIDRARTCAGPMFTMLPSQKVWIWSSRPCHNRLMTGREAMRLQGYPLDAMNLEKEISDPQMQDLAGNAFASPIIMALLLGVYSHLPEYAWTDDENEHAAAARVSRPQVSEPEELQRVLQGLDSDSGEDV